MSEARPDAHIRLRNIFKILKAEQCDPAEYRRRHGLGSVARNSDGHVVFPDAYAGRPEQRWFQERRKFRNRYHLLKIARDVDDWMLGEWGPCECGEYRVSPWDFGNGWGASFHYAKINYGRVTWGGRFEPAPLLYLSDLEEQDETLWRMPASTLPNTGRFSDNEIPPWLVHIGRDHLGEDRAFDCFEYWDAPTAVYFVRGALSGLIKIGIASDVQSRFGSHKTSASEPLILLGSIRANKLFETFLHGLFEPLRHHGEWFYPHWSLHCLIETLELT